MNGSPAVVFPVQGIRSGRTGGHLFWGALVDRSRERGLCVVSEEDRVPPPGAERSVLRRMAWNARTFGGLRLGVLCYDSSDHGRMAWLGRRARRSPGVRLVCVVHHLREQFRFRHPAYARLMRANESALLRLAHTVVVHTESTRAAVSDRGVPRDRIAVIRQGWRASPPRSAIRRLVAEEPLRLLWVGGDFRRKGLHVLLRALTDPRSSGARLTVIGSALEGEESRDARALAEPLGLGERVDFRGSVADPELEAAWLGHDVYVLPSAHEGHGRAVDEALNHGLPVLLSDLPVFRERLGDEHARFVPVDSIGELAEAIGALRDAPLRSRLADAGYAASRSFPTWQETLDAHVDRLALELDRSKHALNGSRR